MRPPPQFPLEELEGLVRELAAGASDWRALLSEPRYAALLARERWFVDRQKGMFYRLMAPARRIAFLELQAGSGIVSECLAEDFVHGFAMEHRSVFAEFMRTRFSQGAVANVDVLQGRGDELPLDDASIDLVALDEPLSTPQPDPGGAASRAELDAALREALRCLRPGGRIIMAVDNAWHRRRPLTVEEASGDGLQEAGRVAEFTPPAYRRLLRQAGFREPRLFVIKTRRQLPIDIYSHHRESLEQLYRKYDSRRRVGRFVMWLSNLAGLPYLGALFEPSYYLVGER